MRRRRPEIALIMAALAFAAGCGSAAQPAKFQPAVPEPATPGSSPPPAAGGALARPPFGRNVRVEMSGWLPASRRQARAVIAAKNFELAYLYSEYTRRQGQAVDRLRRRRRAAGLRG
jgi:hypothetical protein